MKLFLHVDFQTRFAPQRRTIFHFSSHQVALPTALANLSTPRNYNLKTMEQQCFAIGDLFALIPVLLLRHSISGKFDFSNFLRLGDSLHLNTGFMLRYELFTRTWTQSSCYATECSRALASAHRLLVRRLFSLHLPIDLISCYAKKGLLPHAQGPK